MSIMVDKVDDDFLATNIKGLMMTLVRQWDARFDIERADTPFGDIRPSDMRVFGNMRGRAMRLSEIHREMRFSRQAAQQAVSRLVKTGLLQVDPIAGSRRDKLVTITKRGQARRALAARQIRKLEADCANVIGPEGIEELRGLLVKLVNETAPT